MKTETENRGSIAGAVASIVTWVAIFGFGPVRLLVFPYEFLSTHDSSGHWHRLLTHEQAMYLNVLQWSLVSLAFAVWTRRHDPFRRLALALLVVVGVTVTTNMVVLGRELSSSSGLWH